MKLKLDNGQEFEIPEGYGSVDEVVAKLNELSGQLPQFQQAAQQFDEFKKTWGEPATLNDRLTAHVNSEIQKAVAQAKAEGATQKEQRAVGQEVYDTWSELSPRQQIEFMAQQIGSTIEDRVNKQVQGYWAEAQKQLGGSSSTMQQQFDLLARMVDLKTKHPNLDSAKIWETMKEITTASPDKLMEIALRNVQGPEVIEGRIKEERAKWEEESTKKRNAEDLKVLNADQAPWMKPREERPSLNDAGGEEKMKHSILSEALSNGKIQANQL